MSLALKVFLFAHHNDGYISPQQFLIEELQAETDTPWWHIVGCTTSRIARKNQLIIYARANSSDYLKVQHSVFISGILAEYFAPGYDKYFFSLRGNKALLGLAIFDGNKLKEVRNKGRKDIVDNIGALEKNLIFYTPRFRLPKILSYIDTLINSIRIHLPLAFSDIREKFGYPDIRVRAYEIHHVDWGTVLNGYVVIMPAKGPLTQKLIRTNCRRIINTTLTAARKGSPLLDIIQFLPLRYAKISIFKQNYRKRRLTNFGLGPDLVCIIQVKRTSRIRTPDISGSTIEIRGRYRIAWNAKWLESNS